jgi:glutamate transport system substrate-binding protein
MRKTGMRLLLAVGLAVLALTLGACGGDDTPAKSGGQPIATTTPVTSPARPSFAAGTTMAAIQAKGKLVVGTRFDVTGFALKNPTTGFVEGFDAEMAKLIAVGIFGGTPADAVGKIEFQETDLANREAAISEGRVDVVIVTYPITDARKQQVDFAGPYFMAGQDLMVKAGDTTTKGFSDLNGKKVCLTRTNPFTEPNVKAKAPQAELIVMTASAQCTEALADGRVDAVASANAILLAQLDKGAGAFRLVGSPTTEEPYGIGLKHGDQAFRTFVNDLLDKAYSNGQWASAYAASFGRFGWKTPTPPPVDRYVNAPAAVTSTSRG